MTSIAIEPRAVEMDEVSEQEIPSLESESGDGSRLSKIPAWIRRAAGWLERHPWLLAVVASSMVLVKVLRVTRGDTTIAGTLLMQGGGGIALSVLAVSLPLISAGVLLGASASLVYAYTGGKKKRQPYWIGVGLAALLCLAVAGIRPFIAALVVVFGLAVSLYGLEKKWPSKPPARSRGAWGEFAFYCVVGASMGLVMSAFTDSHWLPAESLTVSVAADADSAAERDVEVITAYVISDSGSYVTYLGEESRALRYIPSGDVLTRRACSLPPSPVRQVIPLFSKNARGATPACSELVWWKVGR